MNAWYAKIYEDQRMKTTHVALYVALFQYWNLNRFQNPFIIIRSELMSLSKIGSKNTYSKCIRDLSEWGYIKYTPSYNAMQGSKVEMYNFGTGGSTTSETGTSTTFGQVVVPYIKHSKQLKLRNNMIQSNKNYEEPL
ncbi:hypothetical protein [Reichenbachiella sp. MALMAid0571]|uniref:hypothetical protein n=1 Tax=Reichenbachiella sp. MALMAid0571 TaxID=3143939 RepID=UPI0032DF698F